MKREEIVPGAIVRFYGEVGYIADVYYSHTSQDIIVFFKFVKNVYKWQRGDIIPFKPDELDRIEPASREELLKEIGRYKGMVNTDLLKLFGPLLNPEATTPFSAEEIAALTMGKLPPIPVPIKEKQPPKTGG